MSLVTTIQMHCTALQEIDKDKYSDTAIAQKVYEHKKQDYKEKYSNRIEREAKFKGAVAKYLNDAKNPSITAIKFGGLERYEVLDKIRLYYATEIADIDEKQLYPLNTENEANTFLAFRQYFVDEENKKVDEENKKNTLIAAGLLLLYYKQDEHRFEYTDFKLHIAPSKSGTYKSFTIEGTVKQLGTAIILQHEKIFGTTVIKTKEEFFGESVLSDTTLYNGAYITYTPANQTLHGEIIIARLDKNDPAAKNETPTTEWAYADIPMKVAERLKGKIRQL